MKRRPWKQREIDLLRKQYGTRPACEIAKLLDRPLHQIYNAANRHGLVARQLGLPDEFDSILRAFHRYGWSDAEIAEFWRLNGWTVERHTVGEHRRAMGLASNACSDRFRRRVAAKTKEQCKKAGVKSLAEVRRQAFQKFARTRGWPEDLAPRCVQMLDAMYERGPMTRRQLAEAIGMRWMGSRKSLCGNGPGGSYLATLMRRGLVVALERRVPGNKPGYFYRTNLYMIPLHVRRGVQHGEQASAGT